MWLVIVTGCDAGTSCVVGASQSCACTDGSSGAQTCVAGGTFGPCACIALDGGARAIDGGARDDAGLELDAGDAPDGGTDAGPGADAGPTCGDRRTQAPETCDDGNRATEACAYGETACDVCDGTCALVAGATAYCGDATVQDGEEVCDGETFCDAGCAYLGTAFEPNDSIDDATRLEALADGTFSHPADMVYGPSLVIDGEFFGDSPDVFEIAVCNGGTLHVRIDFVNADGNLDLRVGRRPQTGGPSGPPPVEYNWSSTSIVNDYESLDVAAPTPGMIVRTHYIRVEADDRSRAWIQNRYTLTGSVTGCP